MSQSSDPDDLTPLLMEALTRLLRDREDPLASLNAFNRGELTADQIINQLALSYQTGIGSAVRGLAEIDPDAAKKLGERLRKGIDAFLFELGGTALPVAATPAVPTSTAPATGMKERSDDVIRREYVMLGMLSGSDVAVRSGDIFAAIAQLEPALESETITTHLARLVKAGTIGRERKGRFHALPGTRAQLQTLSAEIEARGLPLPSLSSRL